jgi:hypothetical protein
MRLKASGLRHGCVGTLTNTKCLGEIRAVAKLLGSPPGPGSVWQTLQLAGPTVAGIGSPMALAYSLS